MATDPPKHSVLIVDDSGVFGFTLSLEFRKNGWDVYCCGSAADGLKTIKLRKFDLILSDMHMPGMQGDELARVILKDRPDARIIIMSSMPRDALPPLPKGVVFLPKPLNVRMIIDAFDRSQRAAGPISSAPPPPPPSGHR